MSVASAGMSSISSASSSLTASTQSVPSSYYATFEIGDCEVYLENGGMKDDSETIKNQLAEVIQKLTENGNLDLTSFSDETGMKLDGNPDGYDPLPDSQTSDEEVSEQDPAAN